MPLLSASQLAPPGVTLLISLLAYGSQVLFRRLEPHSLEWQQIVTFNVLVACIWICYARACLTDPGHVPSEWTPNNLADVSAVVANERSGGRQRWCKRCEAFKPPRAHHCKTCRRCIPKMDHHCPWTVNCVSHRTFPHFLRFLFYAVASMSYLEYFLYIRGAVVWNSRNLPSYLGPSPIQLIFLFILIVTNSLTLFALAILLIRSLWSIGSNITTIESWEIERHKTLLRRARAFGGYLDGPDGARVRIVKQEFPYDIGIWQNIKQAMRGGPLIWLWPLATTPPVESGLEFEVNGFEDVSCTWPPPDPDRISRKPRTFDPTYAFTHEERLTSNNDQIEAFRKRQEKDFERFRRDGSPIARRKAFHTRFRDHASQLGLDRSSSEDDGSHAGEEAWRNSEGDRLGDFGVDEDAEFYDEDDVPIAQLLRRREAALYPKRRERLHRE